MSQILTKQSELIQIYRALSRFARLSCQIRTQKIEEPPTWNPECGNSKQENRRLLMMFFNENENRGKRPRLNLSRNLCIVANSLSYKSHLSLDLRLISDEVEALTVSEWSSENSLRVDRAIFYAELEGVS